MKYCPTCRSAYTDAKLKFCRRDGTPLLDAGPADALAAALLLDDATDIQSQTTVDLSQHARTEAWLEAPITSELGNLPISLTPLIGRQVELRAIVEMLTGEERRLVTLTGPGGMGKTRLALAVGAELRDRFRDGVFFVALAALRDPQQVVPTIAQTLGAVPTSGGPLDAVQQHLRQRQTLLILDNFEQLVTAALEVAELLGAAPHVKVLVTSRFVLRVHGEREFAVPPLTLPDAAASTDTLLACAAVQLFVERARAARRDFALTQENAAAVAEICKRLDGLPLAIELAASRIHLMSPQTLLARMENRLALLTGGAADLPANQQAMRRTIEWSYELLTEPERRLFRQLAVFRGGCTLAGAEAVCRPPDGEAVDLLDVLASLLDKSLLARQEQAAGGLRFSIRETIRQFGLEALEASGEIEAVRRRHAEYYLELAERADPELWGPRSAEMFEQLEIEYANMRAALSWSLATAGAEETMVRLAAALARFWWIRGYFAEGGEWLRQALARGDGAPTPARLKAMLAASYLSYFQGDYARSRELAEQSLRMAREANDAQAVARALNALGRHTLDLREYERAETCFEEALALAELTGAKTDIGLSLNNLGELARVQGRYARARRYYERSLEVHRQIGNERAMEANLAKLGHTSLAQEDLPAAAAFYRQCLELGNKLGDRRGKVLGIIGLIAAHWTARDPARAARLLGAAEARCEQLQYQIEEADRPVWERATNMTRAALDRATFEAERQRGRKIKPDDAVALALE